MIIRLFDATDAEALAALFHQSVHQLAIRDYDAAQLAAWSPASPDARSYVQRATRSTLLVAVADDGGIIGYGDLDGDGHVDHLYCHPDWAGKGVGSAILAALEKVAYDAGISRMHVEASEGARRLLDRRGFMLDARNEIMLGDVAIHNYRMSKVVA